MPSGLDPPYLHSDGYGALPQSSDGHLESPYQVDGCVSAHDLLDFALACQACRKHVLQFAKVRHEPTRLIDGPIWGWELFPADLVKEAVESATRASQSLRTRWDLSSFKRKSQDGSGAQPKNRKRFRSGSNYKIPKLAQPQPTMMVPVSYTHLTLPTKA